MKNRIIFLNDIFDVKNNTMVPKYQFVDTDKKKNLLETSKQSGETKYTPWSRYIGPYLVAQSIEDNLPEWEVVIIDYFTKINNFSKYIRSFINEDTKYIAISSTFLHNPFSHRLNLFNLWCLTHEDICKWFEELKLVAPHVEFIIGGGIIDTIYKTHIVEKTKKPLPEVLSKYFSYAFHGYGEDVIVDFLKDEVSKENIFEKEGVIFINEPKLASSGAKVIRMKWNAQHSVQEGEWLPLEISKGCRFGCKFCFYDTHGTIIKEKNILRDEFLRNYEHYGVQGYAFIDDTINDSITKIDMLYDVITNLPFKVEWISYARPDMFHKYSEMYFKMKDMGCRGMFFGVESLNHEAGKIAGKGLHPDKIKEILRWTKEESGNELFHLGSFIIGLPGETEESLMKTAQWLCDQRCLDKAQYEILFVSDNSNNRTNNVFSARNNIFGFEKVTWNPEYYWKHKTLDSTQCKRIASQWEAIMENHPTTVLERHANFNTSFWAYPRMRSFGLDHYQAVSVSLKGKLSNDIHKRNMEWIKTFHDRIQKINHVSSDHRRQRVVLARH